MVDTVEGVDVDVVEVMVVVSILMMQVTVKMVEDQEEEIAIEVVETEVVLDEDLREENCQKLAWFVTKITPPANAILGGPPQPLSLTFSPKHTIFPKESVPIAWSQDTLPTIVLMKKR